MTERFGALPLGELHAEGVCAYCGHRAELRDRWPWTMSGVPGLMRTVHVATQAVAHVCIDVVACERRRYKATNP